MATPADLIDVCKNSDLARGVCQRHHDHYVQKVRKRGIERLNLGDRRQLELALKREEAGVVNPLPDPEVQVTSSDAVETDITSTEPRLPAAEIYEHLSEMCRRLGVSPKAVIALDHVLRETSQILESMFGDMSPELFKEKLWEETEKALIRRSQKSR